MLFEHEWYTGVRYEPVCLHLVSSHLIPVMYEILLVFRFLEMPFYFLLFYSIIFEGNCQYFHKVLQK